MSAAVQVAARQGLLRRVSITRKHVTPILARDVRSHWSYRHLHTCTNGGSSKLEFTGYSLSRPASINTIRYNSTPASHTATTSPVKLSDVTLSPAERYLIARWDGGDRRDVYPYLWLRDCCECSHCFHPFTKARLILMRNLQVGATPQKVEVTSGGEKLTVTWEDGHVSQWDAQWLWERRFAPDGFRTRKNYIHRPPKLWGAEMMDNIPQFDFEQLLSDDNTLYKWLSAMEDFGFAMMKNAPQKTGQLERFTDHISFSRSTHYGQTFQVKTSATPSNLAYTAGDLGLHTDIPYDRYPPGIQMLHYIVQTPMEGGLSEFSDAFNAAKQLREENPDAYRILVETPVDYIDVGSDTYGKFSKLEPQYTLTLDAEGEVFRVMYSNQTRDSHFRVPPEKVDKFIRALHQFDAILYREENMIRLKPEAGDVSCFYNNRVLHGRSSFEMSPGLERHLEGIYIEVNEITSKRRVIAEEMQHEVTSRKD